ncbi:MAG: sensor histidine kinase [Marmoricola sp.]
MSQVRRVAVAARVFTLAALLATASLLGWTVLRGTLLVLAVAVAAQLVSWSRRAPEGWLAVAEGAAVAALAVALAPADDGVLPYLVVPSLIGGLSRRLRGAVRVLGAEAVVLVVGTLALTHDASRGVAARDLLWLVTGAGLGALGASLHGLFVRSAAESSYRSAVELIRQLRQLSGQLADGLDVITLADNLLAEADALLGLRTAGLFVPGAGGAMVPLRYFPGSTGDDLRSASSRAREVLGTRRPRLHGRSVVLPLTREREVVAVLVAECAHPPDVDEVAALDARLSAETLKLSAGLLFGEVRARATEAERQRLAREIHDGIAQDIASLGYVVDGVEPADAEQAEALDAVRREVSRVVGELRHSVDDLRHDVGTGRGLGEGLATLARRIGSRSPLTVHVTLDEAPARLPGRVESELLRIAQEAMNNARKHSGGHNLWLTCRVEPPYAEVVVRDDGSGLGPPRPDSHGVRIMQERAAVIGAELHIDSPVTEGRGTRVTVRVDVRQPARRTAPAR